MFVTMKMSFYLCPTIYFLAGSYDQTTIRGAAWQVSSQGANADKCTGNQLQLANVANQGNAYEKETYCCGHEIKLARMAKDSRVMSEKCRTFMQHVASGGNHVPAINVVHRWVHESEVVDSELGERNIYDSCSCHAWTASVAMAGQTAVAMPGQLQLPCIIKCDCNV